jgi:hypothetical protein
MEKLGIFAAAIGMLVIVAVFMAWPVQYLWNNCLIPAVDGTHPIEFWQALGLNVLFGILFKANVSSK